MTVRGGAGEPEVLVACWCCGGSWPERQVVHLGHHHEVAVCLDCGHVLHQRALAREDELRPSPAGRARAALRAVRALVIRRGWHDRPVVGRVLRRLGSRLP